MEPVISIICNAYNHEKYIGETLDGFLMQKVNVPFEILINDDKSTDATADIIKSYADKHPDIIKPIYQTVNQYSIHNHITMNIQMPRAKGKYIAFCEGDDYWTDENKLQIQYDFMEANPEYTACTHAYSMVNKDGSLIEDRFDFPADCDIPMSRLIGNQLEVPQFATLFIRKEAFTDYKTPFLGVESNDMIMRIYAATKGKVKYINTNMSAYRRFTEGSWTVTVGSDVPKLITKYSKFIPFLNNLDEYTSGKYHSDIEKCIDRRQFEIDLLKNDFKSAIKRKAYKKANLKRKLYIILGCLFPKCIIKIRKKRANNDFES